MNRRHRFALLGALLISSSFPLAGQAVASDTKPAQPTVQQAVNTPNTPGERKWRRTTAEQRKEAAIYAKAARKAAANLKANQNAPAAPAGERSKQ